MVIIGSAFYLLSERFLDINTLSATLFGLASYGLLGLWMQPNHWRRGLPAALLLIGSLPFGEHLQTFVGYPVRILTATIVGDGLAKLGVGTVGVDTILIFENGISKIDLPCSGVKSLWSGGLFLLAATWIERRSINMHWFLIGVTFVVVLLASKPCPRRDIGRHRSNCRLAVIRRNAACSVRCIGFCCRLRVSYCASSLEGFRPVCNG